MEYAGAPVPARVLRLSSEPLYRYGAAPADHLFANVWVGVLRPDGGVVVLDVGGGPGAGQQVVAIAPDGASSRVLAPPGQGPGEVRQATSLTVLADGSLLVEDDGNGRLMAFGDSSVERSVSLAGSVDLVRGLRVRGQDPDGRLLMTTSSYRSDFTVPWLPGHLVRFDMATLAADTVGSYDMASRRREGRRNPFPHSGIAAVTGGRFVHVRTDVPQLVWRGGDGAIAQILRWNPAPLYPNDEDVSRFRASLRQALARVNPQMEGADLDRFVEQRLGSLEVPAGATLPLTMTLNGDGEGRVWMGGFVPVAGLESFFPDFYQVVGPDGIWLGAVDVPERFRFLDARDGHVLGVHADELGVQTVAVYELFVEPL